VTGAWTAGKQLSSAAASFQLLHTISCQNHGNIFVADDWTGSNWGPRFGTPCLCW
jgi:hypothetical protein